MIDWPTIIREHGPIVWQTARRLLTQDADATDCFQKTFLTAVEWSQKESVRNWPAVLRRIATSRAIEILRWRTRNRTRMDSLPVVADRRLTEPHELLFGGELAERLREALAELPEQQAEVFCLVCIEGFTNIEAAEAMGTTANHAGVLLNRARQTLRMRLEAFDPNRVKP